ncbi:hypothetical protein AMTR_s00126p00117840, partial [Amborella trichopoda]
MSQFHPLSSLFLLSSFFLSLHRLACRSNSESLQTCGPVFLSVPFSLLPRDKFQSCSTCDPVSLSAPFSLLCRAVTRNCSKPAVLSFSLRVSLFRLVIRFGAAAPATSSFSVPFSLLPRGKPAVLFFSLRLSLFRRVISFGVAAPATSSLSLCAFLSFALRSNSESEQTCGPLFLSVPFLLLRDKSWSSSTCHPVSLSKPFSLHCVTSFGAVAPTTPSVVCSSSLPSNSESQQICSPVILSSFPLLILTLSVTIADLWSHSFSLISLTVSYRATTMSNPSFP